MNSHIKIWPATSKSIFCADNYFIKLAGLVKGNLLPPGILISAFILPWNNTWIYLFIWLSHTHPSHKPVGMYILKNKTINHQCVNQHDMCVCVCQRIKMKCRPCKVCRLVWIILWSLEVCYGMCIWKYLDLEVSGLSVPHFFCWSHTSTKNLVIVNHKNIHIKNSVKLFLKSINPTHPTTHTPTCYNVYS